MACSAASPSVDYVNSSLLTTFPMLTPYLGLWATFCPCVIYGQNKQRLRHLQKRGRPLPGGGDAFSPQCRVYCCMAVPCFNWAFQVCGDSDQINVDPSYAALRWAVAQTSAIAMTFAEGAWKIASPPCFVARVRSHRNAGSSSWRRVVSRKGYLFLLRAYWILALRCITFPSLYDTDPCVVHTSPRWCLWGVSHHNHTILKQVIGR